MAAPKLITPTGTSPEQLKPKASGRWPNRNQQAATAAKTVETTRSKR